MAKAKELPAGPALYHVQIWPAPRLLVEAVSPEAAEAKYRERYQVFRKDLPVRIELAK